MKTFKEFRNKSHKEIKTKKAGLDHPIENRIDDNQPKIGKDLNSVSIPAVVYHEIKGPQGKHTLKTKEGKYSLEKGE